MIETLHNLSIGFSNALSLSNIFYSLLGCLIGTMVGVLPGIGPLTAVSLLLPATFGLDATGSLILFTAIFYGAMYGGSSTSVLMKIPGEVASVITCIDGYAMARSGRAGPALAISAIGSYVAGTLSIFGLILFAPPLAKLALDFGPPEYFALLALCIMLLGYMTGGSMIKSLAMIVMGLLFGMVGIDHMSGYFRFSYGFVQLGDGIGIVPIGVGLFGISEVLSTAGQIKQPEVMKPHLRDLVPSREEFRASVAPIVRGSILGFFIGILPGPGHVMSTFISYAVERRVSKSPERFGKGAIEGVAGPEAANNAATSGALIPLLSLGIPTSAITAIMMAALMIHGIIPGPMLIKEQPQLFWSLIASMYIGNLVLLVLNLPMVGLFVNFLRIPYSILYPIILLFCILGVYALNSSVVDLFIALAAGLLGYILRKFDFEPTPIIIGLVLAPITEMSLRQSLIMSGGSYAIFVQRPISTTLMLATLVFILLALKPVFFRKKGGPDSVSGKGVNT